MADPHDTTETDPDAPPQGASEFLMLLAKHNGGASLLELSAALEQLVADVRATGKPGSVTYKVTLKPDGRQGMDDMVVVTDDIAVKAPKGEPAASMWWTTDDNTLSQDHPNQRAFDFPRS